MAINHHRKENDMKRSSSRLSATAVVVSLVLSVAAVAQAGGECTTATLKGSYGLVQNGLLIGRGLFGGVAVITFDGKGNTTFRATQVSQDKGVQQVTSSGTYLVNTDCTGSAESDGATQEFVLVDGGREITFIETLDDRVVSWNAKKQDLAGCTNATLEGRYGLNQNGTIFARGRFTSIGVLTYDGKGNQVYVTTQAYEDTGIERRTLTGTYTVNEDCTGSSSLGSDTSQVFVIVDGGREMLWIATRGDRVITWVLKKQ
jgi:hypothetical protein